MQLYVFKQYKTVHFQQRLRRHYWKLLKTIGEQLLKTSQTHAFFKPNKIEDLCGRMNSVNPILSNNLQEPQTCEDFLKGKVPAC